jgi:hypothetical protein
VSRERWLSLGEVVDRIRAAGYDDSRQTVRRLIDAGQFGQTYRTEAGGHRKVQESAVEEFLRRRQGEAPR